MTISVRACSPFGARMIAALPDLRLVPVMGKGMDNLRLQARSRHDVLALNPAGRSTVPAAELTQGLILAAARSIPLADRRGHRERLDGGVQQRDTGDDDGQ
jgi:phosphoglycerate dehydrogenase-like enzyme